MKPAQIRVQNRLTRLINKFLVVGWGLLPLKVGRPRGHPGLDLLGPLLHGLGALLGPHRPGVGVLRFGVDDVPQVAALDLLAGELPAVVGELDCVAVPLAPQVALQLHLVHDEHLSRAGKI